MAARTRAWALSPTTRLSAGQVIPALYVCLVVAPVLAQGLATSLHPYMPPAIRATVLIFAGLIALTLARAIGRLPLLVAALCVSLAILTLSDTLVAAAAAAAVLLAAFACGSIAIHLIRPARLPSAETAIYAVALGLGVTSYVMLALGLAGLLTPWAALVVIALPAVIARKRILTAAGALGQADLRAGGRAGPMLAAGIAWAIIVLAYAVAPEIEGDSISYHLGLPRVWIDAGRMVEVPEQLQSYYYLAMEMNYTLAMLLAGPAAAKLLSFMVLALAIASVYVVARSMFSTRAAIVAAALFATTPMVAWQGRTTYVDLAATLYVFLGSAAALRATRTRDGRLAIVAGLLLGLAIATKLTAALAVAPILASVAVSMLAPAVAPGRRAAVIVAGGVAFAAALAPWPILRYMQTGNPVFPLFNGLFQSPLWPQVDVVSNHAYTLDQWGLGKDLGAILATPIALSYTAERFDGGPIGSAFGVALLLFPLALASRRGSAEVRYFALIAMGAFIVWVATVPYGRYLLPIVGALTVLAGVGLYDLSRAAHPIATRVASFVPALLIIAAFPVALAGRPVPYEVALGIESREVYLSQELPSYDPLRLVGGSTGRESHVLLLSFYKHGADDEDRLYAPGRVETSSSLWTQDLIRLTDPAAVIAAIRGRGFTHVYVNRRYKDTWASDSIVMDPAFFRTHATLEYEKGHVELYALR